MFVQKKKLLKILYTTIWSGSFHPKRSFSNYFDQQLPIQTVFPLKVIKTRIENISFFPDFWHPKYIAYIAHSKKKYLFYLFFFFFLNEHHNHLWIQVPPGIY